MATINNWFVFYNRETDKITAVLEATYTEPVTIPSGCCLIGYPVAKTAADAINYVEQVGDKDKWK